MLLDFIAEIFEIVQIRSPIIGHQDKIGWLSKVLTYRVIKLVRDKKLGRSPSLSIYSF